MKCENVERILLSREDLDRITKNLGEQITKDYQGKKAFDGGNLKGLLYVYGGSDAVCGAALPNGLYDLLQLWGGHRVQRPN